MNVIAVDDERAALRTIERIFSSIEIGANLKCFLSAREALDYAEENIIDVAFLDIEMNDLHGLLLAKRLKDIYGGTNIVFVTGHREYARNAFEIHASGYLLKPISAEGVVQELENLRRPVRLPYSGIRVQCFGSFDVFVNDTPVLFKRPKAKEALAYLIDRRGGYVSKKELAAILWEDAPYTRSLQSHLFILIREITSAIEETNGQDFVIRKRGMYAVDVDKFSCDYYNYLDGNASAVNSYRGEYMVNYSWAEFTTGRLSNDANR